MHVSRPSPAVECLAGAAVEQGPCVLLGVTIWRWGRRQDVGQIGSIAISGSSRRRTPAWRTAHRCAGCPASSTISCRSARRCRSGWHCGVVGLVEQRRRSRRLACAEHRADAWPMPLAAQPRWVSRIWPTFIREGTPSGLSTMSDRRAVGHERHVLDRHDARDDALCCRGGRPSCRPAGRAALDGQVDLDHLLHAGGSSSPWVSFAFRFEREVELRALLVRPTALRGLELRRLAAASSSARRMSNHCTGRSVRYSW